MRPPIGMPIPMEIGGPLDTGPPPPPPAGRPPDAICSSLMKSVPRLRLLVFFGFSSSRLAVFFFFGLSSAFLSRGGGLGAEHGQVGPMDAVISERSRAR